MGECYICTLETDNLSNCKCTNMLLHDECQLKIIRTNNNCMKCKVCETEYTNVELKVIETTRLNCRFWFNKEILTHFIEVFILVGGGMVGFYAVTILPFMRLISFFIFGISACVLLIGHIKIHSLIVCIYEEAKKGLYIVDKTEVLKIKSEEDINSITDIV